MITNKDIEKALDFLRDSSKEAGIKLAHYEYLDAYTKVIKAEIMSEHNTLPVNAQEREAFRDERYKEQLKNVETARLQAEEIKFLIDAARTKISAWQTMVKCQDISI